MAFMNGAGRYNDHATRVLRETGAAYVMLIVVGGTLGDGTAVQGSLDEIIATPHRLRVLAATIEKQIAKTDDNVRPMTATLVQLDPQEIARRAKSGFG